MLFEGELFVGDTGLLELDLGMGIEEELGFSKGAEMPEIVEARARVTGLVGVGEITPEGTVPEVEEERGRARAFSVGGDEKAMDRLRTMIFEGGGVG